MRNTISLREIKEATIQQLTVAYRESGEHKEIKKVKKEVAKVKTLKELYNLIDREGFKDPANDLLDLIVDESDYVVKIIKK